MRALWKIVQTAVISIVLAACYTTTILAADPGVPLAPVSPFNQLSDQKAGSLLIYNFYSSSAGLVGSENTRISITNTNASFSVFVHLFFVDGATCIPADSFLCLTPNQTSSFLTSDIDPGTRGYIIAVAVDGDTGVPVDFDFLIGEEFVKLSSGHKANLGAEAVAVVLPPLILHPVSGAGPSAAAVAFDNVCYNALPRVLAIDNVSDRASGKDALVVINRIGGSLASGVGSIGGIFGLLYNDTETAYSFSVSAASCQLVASISNNFPRTTPRFEQIIPPGQSGWVKLWATSAVDQSGFPYGAATDAPALLGAVLYANVNTTTTADAFTGGHNLHKLTMNPLTSLIIPIIPPNCR